MSLFVRAFMYRIFVKLQKGRLVTLTEHRQHQIKI